MGTANQEQLESEIIFRSESGNWEEAKREWDLETIYDDDEPGMPSVDTFRSKRGVSCAITSIKKKSLLETSVYTSSWDCLLMGFLNP